MKAKKLKNKRNLEDLEKGEKSFELESNSGDNELASAIDILSSHREGDESLNVSEIRYRRLFETAKDGILILDVKTSKITDANPFIGKLLNFSRAELIGKELWEIGFFKDKDANKQAMTELKKNHFIRYDDLPLETKAGRTIDVEFVSNVYRENGHQVIQCNIRDITDRVQAAEKLEKASKSKDEFIGIASHELKTPITSVKAYAQILEARFRKSKDAKSMEIVHKMGVQLGKLTSLIEDLLDVTKIESGQLEFTGTCFDFNELVTEMVSEIELTTEKHKIVKKLERTRIVCGDRDRIGQVLTNFLTNAIKYSPILGNNTKSKRGKIIVKTIFAEGKVTLCVQDFGIGLSKKDQERIFERFYRASGSNQETYPGLGLGLYISAEIIKRQNGKIWVESKKGIGSRFCFSLSTGKTKTKKKKNG